MASRLVALVFVVSACTTHEEFPDDEPVGLSAQTAAISVNARRLDKPGTFGEVFYTVTVRDSAEGHCLTTSDPLAATWSGVPMVVLSHAQLDTTIDGCTPLELAIPRVDVPVGDANIKISDPDGSISAVFAAKSFDTGTTAVPAMDTWQFEAGKHTMFVWSIAIRRSPPGSMPRPELCFMTPAGAWSVCPEGAWIDDQLVVLMPPAPEVTGAGIALLRNVGVVDSEATSCFARVCHATIPVELEHPANFTIP